MAIRVGVLGCGFIGLTHAVALAALIEAGVVDAEVVAVHDPDGSKAERLAGLLGARCAGSPDELVDGADAVWVCTPTSTHLELARTVVASGRAVYCEKPLGRDLAEAAALARVVTGAGVPCQVGLVLRHSPVFRTLREWTAGGRLGRLMTIVFRDDQFLPVQGHYASTWRADAQVAGGGTLIEHSVHDVDLLAWLAGPITRVTARTAFFSGHRGIEDLATVLVEFDGGPTATLTSVWHQVLSRPSTRRVEVLAEDAVVWLDDEWLGPLHVQTSEGVSVVECAHDDWVADLRLPGSAGDALAVYAAADRAFLDAVTTGGSPAPGIGEALAAHAVVDAAYRSAAGEGTVTV